MADTLKDSNGVVWKLDMRDLPEWWVWQASPIPNGKGGMRLPYEPDRNNTIRIGYEAGRDKSSPPGIPIPNMTHARDLIEIVAANGIPVHVPQSSSSWGKVALMLLVAVIIAEGAKRR